MRKPSQLIAIRSLRRDFEISPARRPIRVFSDRIRVTATLRRAAIADPKFLAA